MTLALLLTVITFPVLTLLVYVARVQRHRGKLPELHKDWWPQFERQFRAHALRVAQQSPSAEPPTAA
jgi:hypothetical protein